MYFSDEMSLLVDIAAAALLSDGNKYTFETKLTSDIHEVLTFCSQLGARVTITSNKIFVQKGMYSENSYMFVGECGDFALSFLSGIASVSCGTTNFNCAGRVLSRLGKNEIDLIKSFGCFISETENGFVIASGYSEEMLRFPPGTDEAFVCGLFIGSVLSGMGQLICYEPGSLSFDCRELLALVLYKYGVTVYYTQDGAYLSVK